MEIMDIHELDPQVQVQVAERLTYRGPWAWASKVSDAPSSELCRAWSCKTKVGGMLSYNLLLITPSCKN